MKISNEYLIQIIEKFWNSDNPNLTWNDFSNEINDNEDLFFSHIFIMKDKGLLVGATSDSSNIGVELNKFTNTYQTWNIPIRLTAVGHDFANALSNPLIKEKIVDKFNDAGLSVLISIAKTLDEKFAEKKLSEIIL